MLLDLFLPVSLLIVGTPALAFILFIAVLILLLIRIKSDLARL